MSPQTGHHSLQSWSMFTPSQSALPPTVLKRWVNKDKTLPPVQTNTKSLIDSSATLSHVKSPSSDSAYKEGEELCPAVWMCPWCGQIYHQMVIRPLSDTLTGHGWLPVCIQLSLMWGPDTCYQHPSNFNEPAFGGAKCHSICKTITHGSVWFLDYSSIIIQAVQRLGDR